MTVEQFLEAAKNWGVFIAAVLAIGVFAGWLFVKFLWPFWLSELWPWLKSRFTASDILLSEERQERREAQAAHDATQERIRAEFLAALQTIQVSTDQRVELLTKTIDSSSKAQAQALAAQGKVFADAMDNLAVTMKRAEKRSTDR